ncbi:MAG TPA: putative peptidoglycan glycosyltransferase FtsW [Streptosporangiaceae bacterium]|nr:putative peptidoglycan glycosyltransferase FtsW [Streptosporangiaceae bacterium]
MSTDSAQGESAAQAPGAVSRARPGLKDRAVTTLGLLDRPLTSYYLVLGITLLLLALGLVMVLSTSSAYALVNGLSLYGEFEKQLLGVIVGLPLMWAVSKCPARFFRALAYPMLVAAVLGLIAVLAIGQTVNGGERWIQVGPLPIEPSELAKLAFLLWGADLLARKEKLGQLTDWRHLLIPLMPGAAILSLLVLAGDDLGTTFVLLVIFLALLWVIGTPGSLMLGMLGLIGFVLLILVIVAGYRLRRITAFFSNPGPNSALGWQPTEGKYAVGSGGLFGVGMGASRAKWGWVPESTTDFIFAILGEELGLVGTLCVTLLYGGLAYAGLRIARRVTDTFVRLAAAAITAWIVAQAVVNIGSVLGLLPITGVPLPLISAGLSSLLVTMVALGMLLAFARREPGAAQALAAAGPGVPRRILSWLGLRRRPG